VSAFGYGGTNAHAILENVQSYAPGQPRCRFARHAEGVPNGVAHGDPAAEDDWPHLLVFSTHDEPTLKNNIAGIASSCRDANPIDLAYTLALRRTRVSQRAFTIGRKTSLEADINAAFTESIAAPAKPALPAFIFTGKHASTK
jgi:acyl transferase domain-containing protein